MTKSINFTVAVYGLLFLVSPTYAASCASSVASLQAKVDAAVERRAGTDSWKRESVDAKLGHQPSPFSLAATEGERGSDLDVALESLDRARAADQVGDTAVCRRELSSVRAILRRHARSDRH